MGKMPMPPQATDTSDVRPFTRGAEWKACHSVADVKK
jgi:hypothetical protein